MPADPHIKAALDAAEDAWWNVPAGPDGKRRTAAAIAAFLRAMPATEHQFGMPCPETCRRLAAAVEAAARDA
jgi:hypothetical protein